MQGIDLEEAWGEKPHHSTELDRKLRVQHKEAKAFLNQFRRSWPLTTEDRLKGSDMAAPAQTASSGETSILVRASG